MKFTTYLRDGQVRLALVDGSNLIDLNDADPRLPSDLCAGLRSGMDLHAAATAALPTGRRQPLDTVQWAPLVP